MSHFQGIVDDLAGGYTPREVKFLVNGRLMADSSFRFGNMQKLVAQRGYSIVILPKTRGTRGVEASPWWWLF